MPNETALLIQDHKDEIDSLVEESPEKHIPRLANITLTSESSCRGTIEDREGDRQLERFNYYSTNLKAQQFMQEHSHFGEHAEYISIMQRLGLKDINANIFSREQGELGENLKEKNVYVLLHGWTGNNRIYSDIKQENNLTVVEEIMAKDPTAVVIAMDGNGFGETNFRDDVVRGNIKEHCTPEAYAEQVDFFISDVLGFDDTEKKDVNIMGHSMGGAATIILGAKYGYNNTVALAPALFPKKSNMSEIEQAFEDPEEASKMEHVLRALGYRTQGDGRYAFVGAVSKVGALTKKAAPKFTGMATDVFFNFVGPGYMGEEITGKEDVDNKIVDSLMDIHGSEVGQHELVDYALTNLRRGVDFSDWSLEELERINETAIFTSQQDKLVTPNDVVNLLKTLAAYELIKASEKDISSLSSRESYSIRAQIESVKKGHGEDTMRRIMLHGGHYASVFNEIAVEALVDKAIHLKEQRKSTSGEINSIN